VRRARNQHLALRAKVQSERACRAKNCTQHPVTDALARSVSQSSKTGSEKPVGDAAAAAFSAYQFRRCCERDEEKTNKGECGPPPPHLLCERTNAAHANPQTDIQNRTSVSHLHPRCDNCTSQLKIYSTRAEILLTSNNCESYFICTLFAQKTPI
jgi:hypothetical protein